MKERIWGGRALEQFGLTLPEGSIGEGWMIGDHPNGTTKVMNGELAGLGLDDIRERYGREFFGTKGFSEEGRFPLLIKLLDCNDDFRSRCIQPIPMKVFQQVSLARLKCGTF